MLIAALVFAVSAGLLLQFFVAYCRSLIARSYALELSEQAHLVTGIDDHLIATDDFPRLLHLARLCPGPGDDRLQLGAVRLYYSILNFFAGVTGTSSWLDHDRKQCGYFAAVALDRRMAHSRDLLASHMANRG
jgi:hypothetical protein